MLSFTLLLGLLDRWTPLWCWSSGQNIRRSTSRSHSPAGVENITNLKLIIYRDLKLHQDSHLIQFIPSSRPNKPDLVTLQILCVLPVSRLTPKSKTYIKRNYILRMKMKPVGEFKYKAYLKIEPTWQLVFFVHYSNDNEVILSQILTAVMCLNAFNLGFFISYF